MDDQKKEQAGIAEVTARFRDVPCVIPQLSQNDKTISFDGSLDLHSSDDHKVDTFCGQIGVQVKGTCSKLKSDTPKRTVRVSDLRNYLKAGGVIYFVAFIRPKYEIKVFYKTLLPYELKQILATCENKKSVAIKFTPLPRDSGELYRIVRSAIRDKNRQLGSIALPQRSISQYAMDGLRFPKLSFTLDLAADETPLSLKAYRRGVYLYGVSSWGEFYPLLKIENVIGIEQSFRARVSSGRVSFSTDVHLGEDNTGKYLSFDSYRIDLGSSSFSLKEKGPLGARIRDLKLLASMLDTGHLSFDGTDLFTGIGPVDHKARQAILEKINCFESLQKLFSYLHVKVDLDMDSLTDEHIKLLNLLYRGFSLNERLHLAAGESGVATFRLPSFSLKIACIKNDQGTFGLRDALNYLGSDLIGVSRANNGNDSIRIPLYLVLDQEDYQSIGNIDSEVFSEQCEIYPANELSAPFFTDKMLEMLKAYDGGAACSQQLLECCHMILEVTEQYSSQDEFLINSLQVTIRERQLTDEEKSSLSTLIATSDNQKAKTCAAALLGNPSLASAFLNHLEPLDREALSNWPIWQFIERKPTDNCEIDHSQMDN